MNCETDAPVFCPLPVRALCGSDLFSIASFVSASRTGAARRGPKDGTRHCATRSFTTLVTNGSFITISGAMMSGHKLVRSTTRRSPNGLQMPTATVLFEAHKPHSLSAPAAFCLAVRSGYPRSEEHTSELQ